MAVGDCDDGNDDDDDDDDDDENGERPPSQKMTALHRQPVACVRGSN
jgi:hypothetical protein